MAKTNLEVAYEAVEAEFATLRTRVDRMKHGMSAYPEFNVGVCFDSRNPAWAQPNHPIWRGSQEWGFRAECVRRFFGGSL